MEFQILGPLEVVEEGRPVALGGQKQRALLALLLLEANNVVSRDRLIDALWEDEPPDTALKAVQVYVSNLRKLLGRDRILTKAPGYAIRVEPGELDLEPVRTPRRRGRSPAAERGARTVARSAARRLRPRAVCAARDRAASRSGGWPCSRTGSRPTSRSVCTRTSSPSSRCSSPSTPAGTTRAAR